MEWRDEGVLIAMRLHGETSAIIEVFTAAHGRHAGVVRGGASRKMAAMLQPGSQVQVALSTSTQCRKGRRVWGGGDPTGTQRIQISAI